VVYRQGRLRAPKGAQYSTLCGVYICSWRSHQSANGLHVTDQVTSILGITYEYDNTKVSFMHDVFILDVSKHGEQFAKGGGKGQAQGRGC
jgi:hypothetical protein